MSRDLVTRILRRAGWELHRVPRGGELRAICSHFDASFLVPLDTEEFRDACPPLFPTLTEVPRGFHLESLPSIKIALNSPSVSTYFRTVEDGDGRYFVCDAASHQYFARQRMFHSIYVEHIGPSLEGRTVLDVGCSSGYFGFFCARLGGQVLGLDARNEHADHVQLFAHMLGVTARTAYRNLDVEFDLGKIGEQFDLVLASGVLYHVYDHPRFLKELYSLTKRVLVIDTQLSERSDVLCLPGMEETGNPRMSIHGPVLKPSLAWTLQLLRWAGFTRLSYVKYPEDLPDYAGYGRLRRAMVVASKNGS